ncbi:hypothetical protein AGRA3207_000788 [Actinomadura graeca]|uniref:Uncharacterized protein n=1 Tax=Actinomadura graeca TaxID=2750812 RepID=A0ABX8QPQ8_9ACTN|nr:hypothetical protein [Actinomadura graeca]QXJ20134.1 hypothetical protein AGRA3207_000788 [Actinomadura graeca]
MTTPEERAVDALYLRAVIRVYEPWARGAAGRVVPDGERLRAERIVRSASEILVMRELDGGPDVGAAFSEEWEREANGGEG